MPAPLTLAVSDYEHVRDLANGAVAPEGVKLATIVLPVEEIFRRFLQDGDWDAAEMSMGMYCAMRSRGEGGLTAIPVFPSRIFRQSAIYVRAGGPVRRPEDLAGRRIGLPQWSQTTMIYVRGWMADDLGIDLGSIRWVQAGLEGPGRKEPVPVQLPDGIEVTFVPDRSLSEMLRAGDIDALIASHPPAAARAPDGGIVRLVPDSAAYEADYHARTGVFPIMHLIAIRDAVLRSHPEFASALLAAFEDAKRRAVARLVDVNTSRFPVPWLSDIVGRYEREFFGGEGYWPYGLAKNRANLETFLRWCHEQGVCARRLAPEELFPEELKSS